MSELRQSIKCRAEGSELRNYMKDLAVDGVMIWNRFAKQIDRASQTRTRHEILCLGRTLLKLYRSNVGETSQID